jgi:hypothetical protein
MNLATISLKNVKKEINLNHAQDAKNLFINHNIRNILNL